MVNKVDKTDKRYIALLSLLNMILTKMNQPNITEITEFKDIDREDILKDEVKHEFDNMLPELLKEIDPKVCSWSRRNTAKAYIITFIKQTANHLGYKFKYKHLTKMNVFDGKTWSRTCVEYSITQ